MTLLLLLLTASVPAAERDVHEKNNPVYQQLRRQGIALAAHQHWTLPAPVMPDDLDAKAQQAVLRKLLADDIDIDNFLAESVTAPQLLKLPDQKQGDRAAQAHSLDLYFVAHGDLDALAEKTVLDRLVGRERGSEKSRTLTSEELKLRKIVIAEEAARHESFSYGQANILVRVQVRAVGHSFWSRGPVSIVLAAKTDDRFDGDPEFPNQWRALIKGAPDEEVKVGPPQPYRGAAYYVKITRLEEPAGAVFVEAHVVFTEPTQWFDGENPLRSKLPAATMSLVRQFRRELLWANKKKVGNE
jgi:hypothetical protein